MIALLVILAVGLGIRAVQMPQTRLWVDEAESTINALTILEHGYPVDHYQGLPKYENVLIRPWEDHPEYEFRDVSYSSRGVPVYHAWLPMYAMAGSMAAMGVGPDPVHDTPRVLHESRDMVWRTVAPRLPGLLFSLVFMLSMFAAGRAMGGPAAGWAALLFAALAHNNVYLGIQARYYSATLAFTAASLWCTFMVLRHGRWRDFVVAGVVLALLFHTHILSAFVAVVVFGLTLPWMWRDERVIGKVATTGGILAAAALPWLVGTDFLSATTGLPRAYELMSLPGDLINFIVERRVLLTLLLVGAMAAGASWLGRHWLPVRLTAPFHQHFPAYVLLGASASVAFLCFNFLIPAASYFPERLSLMLLPPVGLMLAMVLAHGATVAAPRWAALVASVAVIVLMGSTHRLALPYQPKGRYPRDIALLIDRLSEQTFEPGTRFYSTPNNQFVISYYTGLPVQSVAPVRDSFLNQYERPIVLIEFTDVPMRPDTRRLREDAEAFGVTLTAESVNDLADELLNWKMREQWRTRVGELTGEVAPPPEFARFALREMDRQWTRQRRRDARRYARVLMFNGYEVNSYSEWWQTFFYRFVDPEQRSGEHANYRDRVRQARSMVLPAAACVVHFADQPVPAGDVTAKREAAR